LPTKPVHPRPLSSKSAKIYRLFVLGLATGGGIGFAPLAPGTFGSLATAALFLLYFRLAFASLQAIGGVIVLLILVGCWVAERAGNFFAREDDGRIVIDEVAGQLLALVPLAFVMRPPAHFSPESGELCLFLWVVTGFVLFRLFDIWKPGPIGWIERRFSGGVGVMLDDVAAGALAAFLLGILLGAAHAVGLPIPSGASLT